MEVPESRSHLKMQQLKPTYDRISKHVWRADDDTALWPEHRRDIAKHSAWIVKILPIPDKKGIIIRAIQRDSLLNVAESKPTRRMSRLRILCCYLYHFPAVVNAITWPSMLRKPNGVLPCSASDVKHA